MLSVLMQIARDDVNQKTCIILDSIPLSEIESLRNIIVYENIPNMCPIIWR